MEFKLKMEIISRVDTKALGLKKYFTGKPCSKGHICEKRVSNYECVSCSTLRTTSTGYRVHAKNYNSKPENKIKNRNRMNKFLAVHTKEEINAKKLEYSNSYTNYAAYKDSLTIEEDPRESDDGVLEVRCANCREYFTPKQMHVNKRVQCLKGNYPGESRLYCSEGCKDSCVVYNKHSDVLLVNLNILARPLQSAWAKLVKERDNFTCKICGDNKKVMYAHHIDPVSVNPMESLDVDNGITLCEICHKKVHKIEGCKYHELRCD